MRDRIRTLFLPALAAMLIASGSAHATEAVEKFFGNYVGSGTAEVFGEDRRESRDLDVTLERHRDDGFTLK